MSNTDQLENLGFWWNTTNKNGWYKILQSLNIFAILKIKNGLYSVQFNNLILLLIINDTVVSVMSLRRRIISGRVYTHQ